MLVVVLLKEVTLSMPLEDTLRTIPANFPLTIEDLSWWKSYYICRKTKGSGYYAAILINYKIKRNMHSI